MLFIHSLYTACFHVLNLAMNNSGGVYASFTKLGPTYVFRLCDPMFLCVFDCTTYTGNFGSIYMYISWKFQSVTEL